MTFKSLRVVTILLVSAHFTLSAAEGPETSVESFKKTLITTAGPNGRSCGEVPRQGSSKEAFQCARRAIEADAAFWVIAQKQAADSLQWVGAARDEHGILYQIHFDPPRTESSGVKTKATFTIDHCSSLKFDEEKNRILCVPSRR